MVTPIEAEGNEYYQGKYKEGMIKGPSHERGGVNMLAVEGDFIYPRKYAKQAKMLRGEITKIEDKMKRLENKLSKVSNPQLAENTYKRSFDKVKDELKYLYEQEEALKQQVVLEKQIKEQEELEAQQSMQPETSSQVPTDMGQEDMYAEEMPEQQFADGGSVGYSSLNQLLTGTRSPITGTVIDPLFNPSTSYFDPNFILGSSGRSRFTGMPYMGANAAFVPSANPVVSNNRSILTGLPYAGPNASFVPKPTVNDDGRSQFTGRLYNNQTFNRTANSSKVNDILSSTERSPVTGMPISGPNISVVPKTSNNIKPVQTYRDYLTSPAEGTTINQVSNPYIKSPSASNPIDKSKMAYTSPDGKVSPVNFEKVMYNPRSEDFKLPSFQVGDIGVAASSLIPAIYNLYQSRQPVANYNFGRVKPIDYVPLSPEQALREQRLAASTAANLSTRMPAGMRSGMLANLQAGALKGMQDTRFAYDQQNAQNLNQVRQANAQIQQQNIALAMQERQLRDAALAARQQFGATGMSQLGSTLGGVGSAMNQRQQSSDLMDIMQNMGAYFDITVGPDGKPQFSYRKNTPASTD